jgi:hypothetical protein
MLTTSYPSCVLLLRHTLALQELQLGGGRDSSSSPSVRAIMGRIAYNNPQSSYLITGA